MRLTSETIKLDILPLQIDQNSLFSETPTILTIDDDPLVRQSILMYLEDCGYQVLEAENGREGLAVYRDQKPNLILCDLRMPEINGMELLEIVTKESPDTPVIMISGAGMINDVVESLRLGALDYLVKPISDLEVLGHAVKQALTKQQLEQENQLLNSELDKANKELQSNLNDLKEDKHAGRRAQVQLLPPPESEINGYQFLHTVIPSSDISGDFLDYFEIDDRFTGFYIADVSDHGTSSAFVTMMIKSLFNQPIRNYRVSQQPDILSPATIMSYLNKEILAANLGKQITLFYGVIDAEKQSLSYAIAGQFPRPVLITPSVKRVLPERGFPLGMFDWATFESFTVEFKPSHTLAMFSDGILSCITPDDTADESQILTLKMDEHTQVSDLVKQINLRQNSKPSDDVSVFIVRHLTRQT